MDAQPPAHGQRHVPGQAFADRLASRRGLLPPPPGGWRVCANNGGWQWAASTVPTPCLTRIFNPTTRPSARSGSSFIADLYRSCQTFLLASAMTHPTTPRQRLHYPAPIVDHKRARQRALKRSAH
ncbi:hypothetical protein DSL92_01060 [Billgrantia gudaonensis]|uniref:Cryptochrome/DNA photolyase FAD-binding domain-containing protein n=1 Tax=Billgrantia gudaonensis TaxID=376427 RepID=A0A3S0NEL7_9GAMM|nr:hypothetical protein DSL92_01060 [Halomonas gudaonensis]